MMMVMVMVMLIILILILLLIISIICHCYTYDCITSNILSIKGTAASILDIHCDHCQYFSLLS